MELTLSEAMGLSITIHKGSVVAVIPFPNRNKIGCIVQMNDPRLVFEVTESYQAVCRMLGLERY
jgi:hypothetical protein